MPRSRRAAGIRRAASETILCWAADKVRHIKTVARHQSLPDWLVRRKDPVPLLEPFRVAAATTRIHAYVMAMIDGRRSIKDMAALMQQERLMPADDAETAIQGLLIKLFDEGQIRRP